LREHPESFGETPENFEAKSNDEILERVAVQIKHGGFILSAASKTGNLIGIVALAVNEGEKSRHRRVLWGMYVVPEARTRMPWWCKRSRFLRGCISILAHRVFEWVKLVFPDVNVHVNVRFDR
jgi:hypothetical protein